MADRAPARYPARQTLESFQAIANRHGIPENQRLFVQQSPEAIDAGVFHNDVISVGDHNVFLYHEDAFVNQPRTIDSLEKAFASVTSENLTLIPVWRHQLSLEGAVQTYLFNSQLLRKSNGSHLLVVPEECNQNEQVQQLLLEFIANPDNPIDEILTFDLKQSMQNGGGPACLRNRITLNLAEREKLAGRLMLDDSLFEDLRLWICRHYRESLSPSELADPLLLSESRHALDELCGILELQGLYEFQQ